MAQVLVQNRVSLALPVIPQLVQNEGINVKKMSPNTLMIVNLISPDNRYNDIYLSNYATIYVRDELGRLPGVGSVTYLGQRDYSLRVWLEADKMAAAQYEPRNGRRNRPSPSRTPASCPRPELANNRFRAGNNINWQSIPRAGSSTRKNLQTSSSKPAKRPTRRP